MDINIKRISEKDFKKFSELIYKESGIYLKETKITLLSNRLRKRLQALELNDFSDYYNYLQNLPAQEKRDEYEKMLDEYYELHGWDNNGIPTQKTLDQLGLVT